MSTTDERDGSTVETARLEARRRDAAAGDDIVVLSSADPRRPGRRDLVIGLVTVALLIVAGLVTVVLVIRNSQNEKVRTTSPTVATAPVGIGTGPRPTTVAHRTPTTSTHAPATGAVVVPTVGPNVTSGIVVAPMDSGPAPTVPPTTGSPTTAPAKQYGASALTWSAPHSMTVLAESTAILAVAAHNHTDGTVTLPHPLTCAPRLDHDEICPAVVQVLTHGTSAGAQYTIDAHGIAPGHYSLKIEGVLTVAVTVKTPGP